MKVKQRTTEKEVRVTKHPDYAEGCYSDYRRTFFNKNDSSLRKTIVNLVHPAGGHHKLVFVRYYFKGAEEHRIKLTPHGSSKAGCAIPYLRTYKSTVSKMKNNAGGYTSGMKRVVQEIEGARALQFCRTTTAEWEASEVPEERVTAAIGGGPHFPDHRKNERGIHLSEDTP